MKNIIKKIASITMAFTLLGTGTAVTKTISPNYDGTLTASSANSVCQYHDGSIKNGKKIENYYADDNGNRRCKCCKQVTGEICKKHKWIKVESDKKYNYEGGKFAWMCDYCHYDHWAYSHYYEWTETQKCQYCGKVKSIKRKWQRDVYDENKKYHYTQGPYDKK